MIIHRTSDRITVAAPAKVNLFLEVLGKRQDGFHEVQTVLCPISLFDELSFEVTDSGRIDFQLCLPHIASESSFGAQQSQHNPQQDVSPPLPRDPAWDIPADDRNLVVRAVQQVQKLLGTNRGCRIELTKTIPAAAGLGGGSSDTAAAVVASLLAWDKWDRQLAQTVCAAIGSDIPFFLGNPQGIGLAVATGRGENCQAVAAQPTLKMIVTHPPVGCSTREVYLNYANTAEKRDFRKIVAACETGFPKMVGAELFNALQFAGSGSTYWIQRQLQLFSACGAPHAIMSGSGSSCFALIDDASRVACVRHAAAECGLLRVFPVEAWYGDSIEHQDV